MSTASVDFYLKSLIILCSFHNIRIYSGDCYTSIIMVCHCYLLWEFLQSSVFATEIFR